MKLIIIINIIRNIIRHIIKNIMSRTLNNETIGISFEKAWCIESEIECKHNEDRINYDYVNSFRPIINKFLVENPEFKAIKHIGGDNEDTDCIILNNKTLSLKTLKRFDGKICPQNIGQPSYSSFDKIWNLEYQGKYEKNELRLDFIKKNIKNFLNTMLRNLFCCDYEIIGFNCEKNIRIELLKKPTNMNYFNDFDLSQIIFTRPQYEEKWNETKQKNSEYSTTIKLKDVSVGELQFHKTSRKVIKFRFFSKFLKII